MSKSYRLVAAVMGLTALSACSSGGSGGPSPTSATASPAVTTISSPPPAPMVSALQDASLHGSSPLFASASTPDFSTNLPAVGTVFPLSDTVALVTQPGNGKGATVTGYTFSPGTTLTYQGTQNINGTASRIFELTAPAVPLDVPNIANGSVTQPDGSHVTLTTMALNYTLLGFWAVTPATSTTASESYWARGVTGYQTPAAGVPASGTAHYLGGGSSPGGVFGDVFIANGTGITNAGVSGQASVDVNFSTGAVTGAFTNMTVSVAGDVGPLPFNNVSLSGALSGSGMRGTTTVTNAPTNSLSMSNGATGTFVGALFGPNGQELGASWNLYDPTGGGKSANGVVGAATP